jgi:tRNA-splicing ligase RtcB
MKYFDYGAGIKSWCTEPDAGALEQAKNIASLPFIFREACLMPDAHAGYGMPIGGVLALKNVVIPNAVGVDIGCGMVAVRTNLTAIDRSDIKKIMQIIRNDIPVGMKHHKTSQCSVRDLFEEEISSTPVISLEAEDACRQIGTMGSGNHFWELQRGSDGFIWFMIHSGSRNIGKKVADYHNAVAKELNKKWNSPVPDAWQLAYLPMEIPEARSYWQEMRLCLKFAQKNRTLMAERTREAIAEIIPSVRYVEEINIHHNYAALETHYGTEVVVHRKGATSARKGQLGLIPGSQGTSSYVVRGKGNPESFMSCSHGAGRKMGRREACRTLSLEHEKGLLDSKGIIHAVRNVADLEEAAGAYKDIDEVMREQADLVDIVVKLEPLAVVKG